jgi:hypothetical protein
LSFKVKFLFIKKLKFLTMKPKFKMLTIGIICISLLLYSQLFSQNYIQVDETFVKDTTIRPFENIGNIFGLKISGTAYLNSDTSLIRVIFTDNSGENYLTYEIYPLLDTSSSISLKEVSEETCLLDDVGPYELTFQLINASIYVDYLTYLEKGIDNLEYVRDSIMRTIIADNADKINGTIQEKRLPWYADVTSFALKTYQEKLDYFGTTTLPNLQGIEYYIGGFFVLLPLEDERNNGRSLTITDEFDWRNRHGANDPNSPYYDGDETGSGWIPNRFEGLGCADCWAFAPVYTTEAIENLYYNQQIDRDLSEQNVISCVGDHICNTGGFVTSAIGYIRDHGVMNEECFPYQPWDGVPCSDSCQNPQERILIDGYTSTSGSQTEGEYYLKRNLIINGPQSTVMSIWGHAITMVGFGKIKVGDLILDGNHAANGIEKLIEEGDPWIGKTYWIFKNSWGNWGSNGTEFYSVIADAKRFMNYSLLTPLTSLIYDDSDIRCVDLDSDGYYNWGLSLTKPNTCPTCSDSCDCDDSKPYFGPYDANYNCTILCDKFILSNDTLFIEEDTIWYGTKYINTVVYLENQAKLTIMGNVGFCEGASIIVDRGAVLIIDGGTLHGTCSNLWNGIQVWGTTATNQFTSGAQGKISLINNGSINDAITAVLLGRNNSTTYSGGIIQAVDGHFINNRNGVTFMPYSNLVSGNEVDNLSYFQTTEFLIDAELADESIPENFMYLDGVNGISILGCSLINSRDQEETAIRERGIGIYSSDANFTITYFCPDGYPCEDPIRSIIRELNYGVYAYDDESTKTFEINNTNFYNNLTGVYLSNIDNAKINFDSLEIRNYYIIHQPGDIYGGVYFDNCTGYQIEENYFYNDNSYNPLEEIRSIGITVNNSGNNYNLIYRNQFDDLQMAILAQNGNRGTGNTTGLKLKCNICTNNQGDFAVTGDGSSLNQGISIYQGAYIPGDLTSPASNLFTHANNSNSYSDFNNNLSRSWIYYFHHNGTSQNLWVPLYYQNITKMNTGQNWSYISACPTHFHLRSENLKSAQIEVDEETLKMQMIEMAELRDSAILSLNLWIDAGNTQELNEEVQTSTVPEALDIYDELIDDSPYLSDSVLTTSLSKEDVLVNSMIRDIMIANPHGIKNEDLREALEQRVPPLPEYMIAEIMDGLDSVSTKEQREAEIAWYQQKRDDAFNQLVMLYLTDTTIYSREDSLVSLIETYGGLTSHYFLTNRYMEKGDLINAFLVLSNLPNKFTMDSEQQSQYQDYITIFEMLRNLKQNGKTLDSLNNISREILYQIAEHLSRPAAMAQNILRHIDNAGFDEVYILPTSGINLRNMYAKANNEQNQDQKLKFEIYPNPCKDYFIIDYAIKQKPYQATYSIHNAIGQIINSGQLNDLQNQLMVRTSSYSNGLYTISLIIDGKIEKVVKLNVTK